jgi:heat shock protein HspQ
MWSKLLLKPTLPESAMSKQHFKRLSGYLSGTLLLVLLLGSLLPPRLGHTSASATTRISGTVRDDRSALPLAGAVVSLPGLPVAPARTDASGQFELTDVPVAAPYQLVTIQVQASSYGTWTLHDTPLYPGTPRLLGDIRLRDTPTDIQAGPPLPRSQAAPFVEPGQPTTGIALQDADISQLDPPATIRVARTGVKLCADWVDQDRPVLWVETVPFDEYVRNVLPNEWYTNWDMEALQAGAMAIKHFAWYKILTQTRAPYGADVVDNTCDQYYLPNSRNARTDAAVDATWGYVMHREGRLFPLHYLNSRERCEETTLQPCMPQEGTQEDAQAGHDWQWMLYHYYAPDTIFLPEPPNEPSEPEPPDAPSEPEQPVDPDVPDRGASEQPYAYELVSQSPDTSDNPLRLSEPTMLELRLRNTGSASWYRTSDEHCTLHLGTGELAYSPDNPLRARDHRSPFYVPGAAGWLGDAASGDEPFAGRRIPMRESRVEPGEIATFRFELRLPDDPAVLEGLIGEARAYWTPVVEGPGCDAAQWLAGQGTQSWLSIFPYRYSVVERVPAYDSTHTTPGEFALVLRNEGSATWYRSVESPGNTSGYAVHLATGHAAGWDSDNPFVHPDHASPFYTPGGVGWWPETSDRNRIMLHEEAVPPGAAGTFRFAASVPDASGLLEVSFTPVVEHLGWMAHQEGTDLRVAVEATEPAAPAPATPTPEEPAPEEPDPATPAPEPAPPAPEENAQLHRVFLPAVRR